MKKLLLLCFFAMLNLGSFISAQSREYVTGFGFDTKFNKLVPLTGNRWLAVCTAVKSPGDYKDTVVALVFNVKMELILEKRLSLPQSALHYIRSVVGLSDGGFALSVEISQCDAGGDEFLAVFDQNGNYKWTELEPDTPDFLALSPDGKLFGICSGEKKIKIYDPETGNIEVSAGLSQLASIDNLVFLNGGVDKFIAVGSPGLQLWEKVSSNQYQLTQAVNIPSLYFPDGIAKINTPGYLYFWRSGFQPLFRITDPLSLTYEQVGNASFNIQSLADGDTSLTAIVQHDQSTSALHLSADGNVLDTIKVFAHQLKPMCLLDTGNSLILAGGLVSGPAGDASKPPLGSRQVWLNTIENYNTSSLNTADVQLLNIYNSIPFMTHTYVAASNDTTYFVSGGHVFAQIKNNGTGILESLDLQVGFNWFVLGECFSREVKLEHFNELHLAPGDSTLLDFGALSPGGHVDDLKSLCFWTSAPNHLPDANPQDDIYCKSLLVLDAEEPYIQSVPWLSPNPTTRTLRVSSGKPLKNLRIFNISGTEMNGFPSEITDGTIDVGRLPAGVYFAVFLSEGVWEREKFIKL